MTSAAVATTPAKQSLVAKFASKYSIEPEKLLATLKATAFKVKDGEVTNEQMAVLLIVADQYDLNPFTREIFAFPDKQNGIVPVVSVDGWARIINEHPQMDGLEFKYSDARVEPGDKRFPGLKWVGYEWIESVIYRKDRSKPITVREFFEEVYRPPFTFKDGGSKDGPWQSHNKRFHRHKALIQGSRVAFGFAGIYDPDEAERIIEGEVIAVDTQQGGVAGLKARLKIGESAVITEKPAEREPGNDPPPLSLMLVDACANLAGYDDGEKMRLYADTLPEAIRGHEDFAKAFHKRLGELAEAATKPDEKGRKAGTPRKRKEFVEAFGRADQETLDVRYDETRMYLWSEEDAKAISAAYEQRKKHLEK